MPPMKVLAFAISTTAQVDRPTDTGLFKWHVVDSASVSVFETQDNVRGVARIADDKIKNRTMPGVKTLSHGFEIRRSRKS